MSKLKKIWKDKANILEGVANSIFIRESIEQVAKERAAICESNVCGFFDPHGTSPKVVMRGLAACSICGCNKNFLVHSMHSQCSLHEIGKEPLWTAELSEDEENSLPLDND